MQGFPEEIGSPDSLRVVFQFFGEIIHELGALLFRAYDRADFGRHVYLHDMQAGCSRPQFDAVTAALAHELGLLQNHIFRRRRDDAVARFLRGGERVFEFVVLPLCHGKGFDVTHQMVVILDLIPAFFRKHFVKEPLLRGDLVLCHAFAQFDFFDLRAVQLFAALEHADDAVEIPHLLHLLRLSAHFSQNFGDHGRIGGKRLHPFGEFDIEGLHGELEEHLFQDPGVLGFRTTINGFLISLSSFTTRSSAET